MKHRLFVSLYFVIVFSLLAVGFGGANSAAAPEGELEQSIYLPIVQNPITFPLPIIPDTTKVLSVSTTQYLTDISPDGTIYTFSQSTPELQTIAPGDIIVGEVTITAPYGFCGK